MNTIGERIVFLRKQKNMTQKELANQLNVSVSALCKWEKGQNQPDIDTIKQIAAFFQVPVDNIIYSASEISSFSSDSEENVKSECPQCSFDIHKKLILILFCLIIISVAVGFFFFDRFNKFSRSEFTIIEERYIEDDIYGEIYEFAILYPEGTTGAELSAYMEEMKNTYLKQEEYNNLCGKIIKISFYNDKSAATNWSFTEQQGYIIN